MDRVGSRRVVMVMLLLLLQMLKDTAMWKKNMLLTTGSISDPGSHHNREKEHPCQGWGKQYFEHESWERQSYPSNH